MSREHDILQIRKYLDGGLDARAMHELEKRALDDPFLMDALDGFEHAIANQQPNLDDIGRRLQQRSYEKQKRLIPWLPISIAASVLIVLGTGIWFLTAHQTEPPKRFAQQIPALKKQQDSVATTTTLTAVTLEKKSISDAKVSPALPQIKSKKNTKGSILEQSITENDNNAVINADKTAATAKPVPNADVQAVTLYKPRIDSVTVSELAVSDANQKKAALNNVAIKHKAPVATETLLQSKVEGVSVTPARSISGVVFGSDGVPITGATVKISGAGFGAVTDINGKFTLPSVPGNATLSVGYIGYTTKKVKLGNLDSLKISLGPQSSSLGEVVVTGASGIKRTDSEPGYSTNKKDNEVFSDDAHPKTGWRAFDDYLKKNALSPDGKTGKVRLSFVIAANGSISQFKIIKSLSDEADKKAIDLISNGPIWVGGIDKQPKEIRLNINFR